jgi:hypothetical protein
VTEYDWVSIVALLGWLVLAAGSYRARRVGAGKTLVLALAWASIFFLAAAIFSQVAPGPALGGPS